MPPGSSPRRESTDVRRTACPEDPPGDARARPSARSSRSASTTPRSTRSPSRTAPARSCSAAPSTTARARPSPMRSIEIFGADSDGTVPRARGAFRRDDHTLHRLRPRGDHRRRALRVLDAQPRIGRRARRRSSRSIVFARGLPDKLHTRIYLPEDDELLAADPLLSSLDADERDTSSQRARPTADLHSTSGCRARRRPCSLSTRPGPRVDVGLLSPVTVGSDSSVDGRRGPRCPRHRRGRARPRARRARGSSRGRRSSTASRTPSDGPSAGEPCRGHAIDASALAAASVAGGNPVIPLVGLLKERVPSEAARGVHRGATSQDIVDSALMFVAARAARADRAPRCARRRPRCATFAGAHRDQVAAARTLTQHAVPTTVGLRAANWLRGVRARDRSSGCRRPSSARTAGRRRRNARLVRRAVRRGCRGRAARPRSPPSSALADARRALAHRPAGRSPNWAMRSCRRSTRSA